MNKQLFLCVLLLFAASLWSQEPDRKNLKGKISAEFSNLADINVINMQTEKYTTTSDDGYFALAVKEGDTLMFSAVQIKGHKTVVRCEDIENNIMFVKLDAMVNQLQEVVVVQYRNINAVALGIIPAGQKSYTPAERKLKTATGIDAKLGLNSSASLDPLFNLISGRTAMLKRDLETEKKELLLEKIQEWYDDKFLLEKLKIPFEYLKAFQYFLVEDKRFIDTLASENKAMAAFLIGELAVKYIGLLAYEKK